MADYWKDNGITKPQEIIVCAACMVMVEDTEVILCGARHWDKLMHKQADVIPNMTIKHRKQGFVNQFGEYRTREEAYAIVQANGQRFDPDRNGSATELYSEGLY